MTGPNDTRLETLFVDRLSRQLASRLSRRSFVSRLGRGLAVTAVSGIGLVATAKEAYAACQYAGTDAGGCVCQVTCTNPSGQSCCSPSLVSINCADLPGGSNACPAGSCKCGCWCISDSGCASGLRRWTDCCGCSPGDCKCVTGCDGVLHQSCCRTKCYGGCGTCNSSKIRCRFKSCVSGGALCTPPNCP
jgi:hypothetical protein